MQPTQDTRSPSEGIFVWLEKILSERKNPGSPFQRWLRKFRTGLTIATVAYFVFLMVMILLLSWWGERNWLLSILLFVPAVLWFVPFILLTPFHLVVRPKLCWISLAALLVVYFVYLDFHWAFSSVESKAGLTLLTNNVGGRKFHTLAEFLEQENPDIIALQDSWRVIGLAKQYPERFVSTVGEFVLVSKMPIRQSGALSELMYRERPIGAWYELQYEDQSIMIYNIHMPTPRPEFSKLRGRGFITEMIGGEGIYSSEVRNEYKEFVEKRMQLAQDLAEILRKEQRPFLVAGDFNMPSHGYLYNLFKFNINDAFGARGHGYGFTFPGAISGWLNLFGAWLRLDYLFAENHWRTDWCRVEPHGVSEHQAVVAHFELQPAAHKP